MARLARRRGGASGVRTGHVCLFRTDASNVVGDDETWIDIANLVEMEGTAINPDGRTKFVSMRQVTRRFDTTNPAPYEEATARPDTGYHGTTLELKLLFLEQDRVQDRGSTFRPSNQRYRPDFAGEHNLARGIATLRNWQREDNSVRGKYRNGRVGFRCDYRPEFNLIPNNEGGYKVVSFETFTSLQTPYWTEGYLVIQYSGYPGLAPGEASPAVRPRLGNYTARQTSLNLSEEGQINPNPRGSVDL